MISCMEQSNEEATDTRRFRTHAQWCTHLSRRGSLKPSHRRCIDFDFCIAPREVREMSNG
jgi:hypothetical protein